MGRRAIGRVVDVNDFGGLGAYDWVRAQLDKRNRYLDAVREMVRAGKFALTAQLAKWLSMPFDEDAAELIPRAGSGTVAYRSTAETRKMIEDGRRIAGVSATVGDERVKAIAAQAATRYAQTGDLAAAMDGITRAVRGAPIDRDTGLPVVRRS